MSAIAFVNDNPDYFNYEPEFKVAGMRVKKQAVQHTRYTEESTAANVARPNDTPEIKEYKKATRRRFTKSVVDKFKTKTSRVIRSSGLSINLESLGSSLREYFDGKNYLYLNRPTDYMTYFFENVYSRSIDDPNAVKITLPVNPENPSVPPYLPVSSGGVVKNQTIPIKHVIVPVQDIYAFDENIFSWYGGKMKVGEATKERVEPWFWIVDNEWFYRYEPVSIVDNKVEYELISWYRHDTGMGDTKMLPVNILLGNYVVDENDNYAYQTSLLEGFLEYGDEFNVRFEDGKAVWVTTSYPIHVMEEMDCMSEGCFNGKVANPDTKSDTKFISCSTCNGTGKSQRPSPYGILVKNSKNGLDESKGGKPYELINPSTDVLKATYEIPFDILQKGERQIGLDVLENKIESGVSREMRFEDVKDKLADISDKIINFIEADLFFTECLVNPNRRDRKPPKVNSPIDFQLKTSIDLRTEAEEALPSDKLEKTLAYLRNIYEDNSSLLKVYEVAFRYSPLLLVEWDEVKDLYDLDVITSNDIVRRENAIHLFKQLSEQAKWIDMTDEQAFKLADEILEKRGAFKSDRMVITDDQGNVIEN